MSNRALAGRVGVQHQRIVYCPRRKALAASVQKMTSDQNKGSGQVGARVKDSRQDRLKLALRENLKRRKSQARGRDDAASSEAADGSLDDASGNGPEH
ncbi:hypothetical protein [Bradyrhizobium macuxiense]|nr:hypothetical protein [Bradyrhizobium macuxiense]